MMPLDLRFVTNVLEKHVASFGREEDRICSRMLVIIYCTMWQHTRLHHCENLRCKAEIVLLQYRPKLNLPGSLMFVSPCIIIRFK